MIETLFKQKKKKKKRVVDVKNKFVKIESWYINSNLAKNNTQTDHTTKEQRHKPNTHATNITPLLEVKSQKPTV